MDSRLIDTRLGYCKAHSAPQHYRNENCTGWAALPPQPRPESAEAHDARIRQEGYKDALEAVYKMLPEVLEQPELGDMALAIDLMLHELANTKGKE